jgi:murein DD-endopeptidase MepM/ murein hydrolase activator NlpD
LRSFMNIPNLPTGTGQQIAGNVSWFGGPHDPEDSGHTASGGTTKEPGIAIYNRATLGGYWHVTAANGRSAILKQTDLGPAPWTHRKIDVAYSALGKLGYNESNFPTGSQFKAVYLGHNPNATFKESIPRGSAIAGALARQISELDQPAFQKAKTSAAIGKLFSAGERRENPLFSSGLLGTKAPAEANFMHNRTIPGVPSVSRETTPAGNEKLGGFLSASAPLQYKRIDQGQDIQTRPGEALLAPGDGEVVAVKADPSGFGPAYPVVKFSSGPLVGQSVYLGHADSALKQGDHFKEGQTIARTSKTGHNAPPGWAEIGMASALGQGIHGQGAQIAPYLRRR